MEIVVRTLVFEDWPLVSKIYAEGIATGLATFETEVPSWADWTIKYIETCRLVAEINNQVVGFAILSSVSDRKVYKGVAEVSVYISEAYRHKTIGKTLLEELIKKVNLRTFGLYKLGYFQKTKRAFNYLKNVALEL